MDENHVPAMQEEPGLVLPQRLAHDVHDVIVQAIFPVRIVPGDRRGRDSVDESRILLGRKTPTSIQDYIMAPVGNYGDRNNTLSGAGR
jgi:hypothetical protein